MSLSVVKKMFRTLPYLALLLAIPVAAGTARIYVMNGAGDTVEVIDPATNKVVQVIEGIEAGHGVTFAPDGSRAYITNEAETVLVVVDTKTAKIIKMIPMSGDPNLPVVTRDGKRVLVSIREKAPVGGIEIIDTSTLQSVKKIPMRNGIHDLYVTDDGKYAIAGSPSGKFLSVIDLSTDQPVWEVSFNLPVLTMSIESNPDGSARRIFVQLQGFGGFAVVDFAKRAEVQRIKFPEETTDFPPNTSHGSIVAPDGKTFWINYATANAVLAYSLPDLKPVGRVTLAQLNLPGRPAIGAGPQWLAFTPDSKTLYVVNPGLRTVSAIDPKTLKVVANVQVGEGARNVSTLVVP
jgi:YVTN family beta-propeller protein